MNSARLWRRGLAGAAIVLGALAAIAGSPRLQGNARLDVASLATIVQQEEDHVTALELADWIRSRRDNLRIIDVRSAEDFDAYHIPGAERIPLDSLVARPFRADETIVLYSDGGAHAAQGWVFLRALGLKRVYFLRGGLYEWLDDVMNPTISASATDSARRSFERTAELSRYFGGVPREGERPSSQPSIRLPVRSSETDRGRNAVARVRGRGC